MTPQNFPYEVARSVSLVAKDTGKALDIRGSFQIQGLEIGSSSDTRFLPAPYKSGLRVSLTPLTLAAGGSCKVAIGSASGTPSTTFDGTNKYATLNAFGQCVEFISVPASAGGATHQWALTFNQGASLSVS